MRVLLGGSEPLFLIGMRAALDADPAIHVAGEGTTADDIIAMCRSLSPDLVLTDVSLPGKAFPEMLRAVSTVAARPLFLVLTAVRDPGTIATALRMGVRGYLAKNASPQELRLAVQIVFNGGSIFGPAATRWLESSLRTLPDSFEGNVLPMLSQREREVLELLCLGTDNQGIARALCIAEKTVRNHVSNLFAKLQVNHRAEAVARGRDAGFGMTRRAR